MFRSWLNRINNKKIKVESVFEFLFYVGRYGTVRTISFITNLELLILAHYPYSYVAGPTMDLSAIEGPAGVYA
jgi:hypothetical protein